MDARDPRAVPASYLNINININSDQAGGGNGGVTDQVPRSAYMGKNGGAGQEGLLPVQDLSDLDNEDKESSMFDCITSMTKAGAWDEVKEGLFSKKALLLFIYILNLIFFGSIQMIYMKGIAITMVNYPYTLLLYPILASAIVFFPVVWWRQYVQKCIPDECTTWNCKAWILLMALGDQLADFMIIYGQTATSGNITPVYMQTTIPSTMFFSFIFLGARYRLTHYLAGLIILGGIIYTAYVAQYQEGGPSNQVYGNLLVIGSAIPAAVSAVVKELCLARKRMDMYYINAWESIFQFVLGILLIPMVMIVPNPAAGIPSTLDGMYTYFLDSAKCVGEINSVGAHLPNDQICMGIPCYPDATGSDMSTCIMKDCCDYGGGPAWFEIILFVLCDSLYNIFLLLIIKIGSASLMFFANALIIPATAVAFTMPWLSLSPEPLTPKNFIGMGIIIVGLFCYRIFPDSDLEAGKAAAVPMHALSHFPHVEEKKLSKDLLAPRTSHAIRSTYFSRLGLDAGPIARQRAAGINGGGAGIPYGGVEDNGDYLGGGMYGSYGTSAGQPSPLDAPGFGALSSDL